MSQFNYRIRRPWALLLVLVLGGMLAPSALSAHPDDEEGDDDDSEGGLVEQAASLLPDEVSELFDEDDGRTQTMREFENDRQPPHSMAPRQFAPCVNGFADEFPCDMVDLQSFIPLSGMNATAGNDVWGWTDPATRSEYALMGLNNGTAFVDISDAKRPVYLGKLPTASSSSSWRDIKVYADHAYVVSEASNHGMQVFDLTQLRDVDVSDGPVTFAHTTRYTVFLRAHNIVINEDSGFAYAVGSRQGTQQCSGGLHMIDIRVPDQPTFAGCFSADGYTHDAQCVIYAGPDEAFRGREVCFNSNENSLTIVDVTTKSAPTMLARLPYPGSAYTHQGWLTEDHTTFLLGDELDENRFGHNTKTYIFDVSTLASPALTGTYLAETAAIDHNMYVKNRYLYQANYRAGLRILDARHAAAGALTEVGYFDIYPANDNRGFNGAWSNFPYFNSGNVLISGIEQGLFVVKPRVGERRP